jgi:NAD(P)-dependent dehydrogenase (short-subunit alcohol dehydrogenase family)
MAELVGSAALITGGTTGLGFEIARQFLEEGASVVLTGRDETLGAAAEERLAPLGAAKFLRADAGDPDQARASVDQAVALLGGLDILVNNAGVGVQAGVLETPLDSYDLVMDVNVRGAFVYAQAAFPHLEARGGAMLHVASDAAVMGEDDIGIYSVSKAALVMLSNMLAIEGGRRGVRSNAVCPGDTAPGMRHMGPPGHDRPEDDPEDWIVPPLGRVGLAIDVAEAAVYLCSARAAFVNGVALLVDGGMRAGMRTDRPAGP